MMTSVPAIKHRHIAALCGVAAMVIGAFSPWATLGPISGNGIKETDGVVVLALALVCAALLGAYLVGVLVPPWSMAGVAVVALGFCFHAWLDLQESTSVLGVKIQATPGWGLWLSAAGALLFIAAVLWNPERKKARPTG